MLKVNTFRRSNNYSNNTFFNEIYLDISATSSSLFCNRMICESFSFSETAVIVQKLEDLWKNKNGKQYWKILCLL